MASPGARVPGLTGQTEVVHTFPSPGNAADLTRGGPRNIHSRAATSRTEALGGGGSSVRTSSEARRGPQVGFRDTRALHPLPSSPSGASNPVPEPLPVRSPSLSASPPPQVPCESEPPLHHSPAPWRGPLSLRALLQVRGPCGYGRLTCAQRLAAVCSPRRTPSASAQKQVQLQARPAPLRPAPLHSSRPGSSQPLSTLDRASRSRPACGASVVRSALPPGP